MRARLFAGVAVVAFASWLALPVLAQQKQESNAPKLDKQQTQELQAIRKYFDDMNTGKAAPADATLTWQPYFMKSQGTPVYVPFTTMLDPGKLTSKTVAIYIRVISKAAAAQTPADKKNDKAPAQYAWEDFNFADLPPAQAGHIRLSRAFAVPAGDYDVYMAVRERPEKDQKTAPKLALLKESVTVPDLSTGLTTSTIILADKIDSPGPTSGREDLVSKPFTFGPLAITPSPSTSFAKSAELSLVFFLYNTGVDSANKPNVEVQYNFHRKTGEGEKFFNKTNPQSFNPQTLPPEFDASKGYQVPAGQSIPLKSFESGEYRLEVTVADKISGQSITRNVVFSVME